LAMAAYILWSSHTHAQLQALLDQYHQNGEAVKEQDFVLPDIPDDQNAAIPLAKAIAEAKIPEDIDKQLDELFPTYLPLSETERALVSKLADTHRQALADAAAATTRPSCN